MLCMCIAFSALFARHVSANMFKLFEIYTRYILYSRLTNRSNFYFLIINTHFFNQIIVREYFCIQLFEFQGFFVFIISYKFKVKPYLCFYGLKSSIFIKIIMFDYRLLK